uniref:Uncharacterized protein n=1 Tax=Anguilla anguilla TaxID=7936 RepID=A0A0E9TDE6_ANGAN
MQVRSQVAPREGKRASLF